MHFIGGLPTLKHYILIIWEYKIPLRYFRLDLSFKYSLFYKYTYSL